MSDLFESQVGARYFKDSPSKTATMSRKIWEHLYLCSVPYLQSRSVEDIRQNGFIVTGIKDLDEGLKNDRIRKYMTINKMVDLYKEGVTIGVVKESDCKDIYDTIQIHLKQWAETIRVGLNVGDAPIDDLFVMDRFAAAVYAHARHMSENIELISEFAQQMNSISGINYTNFFSSKEMNRVVETDSKGNLITENEKKVIAERESFSDRFKESMATLRRYT